MHQDFPKLFAEISTEGAQRELRWAGVKTYTASAGKAKIEVLARLALATKPPAGGHQQAELAAALAAFHQAFVASDPTFDHGSRQDQILAAGALLNCFSSKSVAAIAVTTTACGGARKASLPIDLVAQAENALSYLAALRRRRPDLSKVGVEVSDLTFEPNFDEAQPNQPTTFSGVFEQFRETIDVALNELVDKFNVATKAIIESGQKADEELDMLSWVFGERALTSNQAFTDVPAAQKPLILARDLASLTTIYPGPNSALALLARAGVKGSGKLRITEAVDAMSDDWTMMTLKGRSPSPATSPIHFALAKRGETGAGDAWHAGWAAITGIDVTAAMSPIRLAEQFYREILWLRWT